MNTNITYDKNSDSITIVTGDKMIEKSSVPVPNITDVADQKQLIQLVVSSINLKLMRHEVNGLLKRTIPRRMIFSILSIIVLIWGLDAVQFWGLNVVTVLTQIVSAFLLGSIVAKWSLSDRYE